MNETDEMRRHIESLVEEMHRLQTEVGHLQALVQSSTSVHQMSGKRSDDGGNGDQRVTSANLHPNPCRSQAKGTGARLSRGGLLRTLGAGATGVLGLAVVDSLRDGTVVHAANGNPLILGSNSANLSTLPTALGVTQASAQYVYGFGVVDGSVSNFAESAIIAGYSTSKYRNAILGDASASSANGVKGISLNGAGVFGTSTNQTGVLAESGASDFAALFAENYSTGPGIDARAAGVGVMASSTTSEAVSGTIFLSTNNSACVLGTTAGSGPGIEGTSARGAGVVGVGASKGASGRGGVFSGGAAQVRLIPSGAKTHQKSGQSGDLFVDASRRLWFCYGGARWRRLA